MNREIGETLGRWGKGASRMAQWWRIRLPMQETLVQSLCQEDPLENGKNTTARVGNGNPLWYSCLGNSMDRGAWQATVYGSHKTVGHDLTTEQLEKICINPYKLLTKSRFNILGGNEIETERDWVGWGGLPSSWELKYNSHTSAQEHGPADGIVSGDFWCPSSSSTAARTRERGRSVKSC